MADHEPTTLNLPPREPRALVIPHVLTPELAGLLRIGEALADIKDRLAAVMGRPGGPIASELADLASLTIELLNVVEPDPDLEPSLGFDPHGYDLEAEPEHAEPSLCGLDFGSGDDHDREGGDDNGLGDHDGLQEQTLRALFGDAPAVEEVAHA